MQKQMDEHKKKRDELIKQNEREAKEVCNYIWNNAKSIIDVNTFEYLSNKKIDSADDIKYGDYYNIPNSLIIPLENLDGEIQSLQYIYKDKDGKFTKKFHKNTTWKNNFLLLVRENSTSEKATEIYIVEGWATGKSLNLIIPDHAFVVVAFCAQNIINLVQLFKKDSPDKKIYIAADNDDSGLSAAQMAYNMYGCSSFIPNFPDEKLVGTDWNDLYFLYGIEEMRKQFSSMQKNADDVNKKNLTMAQRFIENKNEAITKFSMNRLPYPLQKYAHEIGKTTDAHPIMIISSILGMMSSYIGKSVYIDHFGRLYPNLWIVCISNSGSFKTTALNKGAAIAFRRQSEIYDRIDSIYNMSPNERRAHGYLDDYSIQDAINRERLNDIVLPTKCTSEALIKHLGAGNAGTIYASEFGAWLQNLTKKYNGDFKGILTDLYDVPLIYRNLTKTQGDDILREPFISIVGVTTPNWFLENFKMEDIEGGFGARIVFYEMPENNKRPSVFPKTDSYSLNNAHSEFESYLKSALDFMGNEPKEFKFTEESKLKFEEQFHAIYDLAESYKDNILMPFQKRWIPTLLKISMLMQLLFEPDSNEISEDALIAAFTLVIPAVLSTASLLQGEINAHPADKQANKVFDWIVKKFLEAQIPITKRKILNARLINGSIKEYDAVLEMLVQQGKLLVARGGSQSDTTYTPLFEE